MATQYVIYIYNMTQSLDWGSDMAWSHKIWTQPTDNLHDIKWLVVLNGNTVKSL